MERCQRESVGEIRGVVVVDQTRDQRHIPWWIQRDRRERVDRTKEEWDGGIVDQRRDLPHCSRLCVVSRPKKQRCLLKLEEDDRCKELQKDGLERGKLELDGVDDLLFADAFQDVDRRVLNDLWLELEKEGRNGKLGDPP